MAAADPIAILKRDREQTLALANGVGVQNARKLLQRAADELEKRLEKTHPTAEFTHARLTATLQQVRLSMKTLAPALGTTVQALGKTIAESSSRATVAYLSAAEKKFSGLAQPLALDTASLYHRAKSGSESSLLNRLQGDKKKGPGILARYGDAVVQSFEDVLSQRLVQRKSWNEVREELVEQSPFLQGKPRYWAERIVRTESMFVQNRASFLAMEEADAQLGDAVKILSATFDDRTGSDSYAVHGQIRRVNEPFESWHGSYMHPPDRPNDREVVIPWRISWPLTPELKPKTDSEVAARWAYEKRKGSPPARPRLSTVPREQFGTEQPLPEHLKPAPQPATVLKPPAEAPPREPVAAAPMPMRLAEHPHAMLPTQIAEGQQYAAQQKALLKQQKELEKQQKAEAKAAAQALKEALAAAKELEKQQKALEKAEKDAAKAALKAEKDAAKAKKLAAKEAKKQKAAEAAALEAKWEKQAAEEKAEYEAQKKAQLEKEQKAQLEKELELLEQEQNKSALKGAKSFVNPIAEKIGAAKGSNEGGFYRGSDGVERYVKFYEDASQAHIENLTNTLYRELKLGAAKSMTFTTPDGKIAYASEIIPDVVTLGDKGVTKERALQALEGFAADVLTANWDAAGMSVDNMVVDKHGNVHRIDNGGSLLFRAKAGRKPDSALTNVTEWESFFKSSNPGYSRLIKAAEVNSAEEIPSLAKSIDDIVYLRNRYSDGWNGFVEEHAPELNVVDKKKVVDMLSARTLFLNNKLAAIEAAQDARAAEAAALAAEAARRAAMPKPKQVSEAERVRAFREAPALVKVPKPKGMPWSDSYRQPEKRLAPLRSQKELAELVDKEPLNGTTVVGDGDWIENMAIHMTTEIVDGKRYTVARFKVNQHKKLEAIANFKQKGGAVEYFGGWRKLKKMDASTLEMTEASTSHSGISPSVVTFNAKHGNAEVRLSMDSSSSAALHNAVEIRFPEPTGKTANRFDVVADAVKSTLGFDAGPPTEKDLERYKKAKILTLISREATKELQGTARQLDSDQTVEKMWAKHATPLAQRMLDDAEIREVSPGHLTLYSPTIPEELEKAGAKMLFHESSAGVEIVEQMFKNNVGLLSSRERYQRGILVEGQSTQRDFETGGADSVFTRFSIDDTGRYNSGWRFEIDLSEAGRLDTYFYNEDQFGSAASSDIKHRKMVDEVAKIASKREFSSSNELMIRKQVPASSIRRVRSNTSQRADIIKRLKAAGKTEINGVPLEEFFVSY